MVNAGDHEAADHPEKERHMSVLDEIQRAVRSTKGIDCRLMIDGLRGDDIEVVSFSWGMSDTGRARSEQGAAFTFHDLLISSYMSPASPTLELAHARGKPHKEAVLKARRRPGRSQADFLVVTMKDVMVTSYETPRPADPDRPVDRFTLTFSSVQIEYRPQRADGSLDVPVHVGWDLAESASL